MSKPIISKDTEDRINILLERFITDFGDAKALRSRLLSVDELKQIAKSNAEGDTTNYIFWASLECRSRFLPTSHGRVNIKKESKNDF